MNEKTMGAIPVSALERLEQSAVKLSLVTFCLRHEELKAAPDAAEIHSIKSDLSRALREVSTNAAACALTGGIPEKAKASTPAGAEPKRVQRKEIHKGTAYGVLRLRCPKCGDVFGRFLREPSASVTCRCGGEHGMSSPAPAVTLKPAAAQIWKTPKSRCPASAATRSR